MLSERVIYESIKHMRTKIHMNLLLGLRVPDCELPEDRDCVSVTVPAG